MVWEDGSVMVYVPAGEFIMGTSDAYVDSVMETCGECKREWFDDEKPQHKVFLNAFWVDSTEVTNAQYATFLNSIGGHKGKCDGQDCIDTKDEDSDSYIFYQEGQYILESGYQNHPITEVGWHGAKAYCEHYGRRLPTEAEWEKAARGLDARIYPWGDKWDSGKVNFCDASCEYDWKDTQTDDGYQRTAPVGDYLDGASPYGALDMVGNVWEWVADWYDDDYYGNSPEANPLGPDSGSYKVMRGGCWDTGSVHMRVAYRHEDWPSIRNANLGFRCAR